MKALGLMEFLGYLPAVDGLDAALKAADVRLRSCRRDGGGLVSLLITGEVSAVKASLSAVRGAAEGALLSASVIARPSDQLAAMIEKIDSLDAECETILKDSRARGEAIREALVADALEEAEKIRNAAHRAADSETKKAIEELRSQMADEIVQAVEATLKEKLDMKKHVKLIDNALKKVVLN